MVLRFMCGSRRMVGRDALGRAGSGSAIQRGAGVCGVVMAVAAAGRGAV